MELAQVRLQDSDQAQGLGEIMKRFRVITVRDQNGEKLSHVVHYVPEAALAMMDGLGMKYELIGTCSEADAIAALRDSSAVAV